MFYGKVRMGLRIKSEAQRSSLYDLGPRADPGTQNEP